MKLRYEFGDRVRFRPNAEGFDFWPGQTGWVARVNRRMLKVNIDGSDLCDCVDCTAEDIEPWDGAEKPRTKRKVAAPRKKRTRTSTKKGRAPSEDKQA